MTTAWNYGKRYAEFFIGYICFGVDIIFASLSPLPSVVGWIDCVWCAPPAGGGNRERPAGRVVLRQPAGWRVIELLRRLLRVRNEVYGVVEWLCVMCTACGGGYRERLRAYIYSPPAGGGV